MNHTRTWHVGKGDIKRIYKKGNVSESELSVIVVGRSFKYSHMKIIIIFFFIQFKMTVVLN